MRKMLFGACGEKALIVAFADFLGFKCMYLSRKKWKWKSVGFVQLFATPWTIQSIQYIGNIYIYIYIGNIYSIYIYTIQYIYRLYCLYSLSLLQGIFPTQGLNPGFLDCRWILYQLSHKGSPRILEWAAFPFSRGSSPPRDWTQVSHIAGRFFTSWATSEALWSISVSVELGEVPLTGTTHVDILG